MMLKNALLLLFMVLMTKAQDGSFDEEMEEEEEDEELSCSDFLECSDCLAVPGCSFGIADEQVFCHEVALDDVFQSSQRQQMAFLMEVREQTLCG